MICFSNAGIDCEVVELCNKEKRKTKLSYLKNLIKCVFSTKYYDYTVEIWTDGEALICPLYNSDGTEQYTTKNRKELIYSAVNNGSLSMMGEFFYTKDNTLGFKLVSYEIY